MTTRSGTVPVYLLGSFLFLAGSGVTAGRVLCVDHTLEPVSCMYLLGSVCYALDSVGVVAHRSPRLSYQAMGGVLFLIGSLIWLALRSDTALIAAVAPTAYSLGCVCSMMRARATKQLGTLLFAAGAVATYLTTGSSLSWLCYAAGTGCFLSLAFRPSKEALSGAPRPQPRPSGRILAYAQHHSP